MDNRWALPTEAQWDHLQVPEKKALVDHLLGCPAFLHLAGHLRDLREPLLDSLVRPNNTRDFDQFAKGQLYGLDAWSRAFVKMHEDANPPAEPAEGDQQ